MTSDGPSSAFDSTTFEKDASFRLDKPVGSASISPCGRDIVLASRQGLHIIDLDSPWSLPRHLSHHTPWEVADVQWSPFAARDYWVVSTSNQKALVWNLAMQDPRASVEHYLHGHSRAITDINFSAHHPDILATCAVDSYVHCWDLRHPAQPAMTFCDWFAGATQVKWNRQDSHILASSHDKFLRIWDDRKGAYPLRSIEAHATKIYGVDWNRTQTNKLATCSLDKTIKFWDYQDPSNRPENTIRTPFPVWRARHTPFGTGLLAMPQRNDQDLHLYDRRQIEGSPPNDSMAMVHRFSGHEDDVKEFLWRTRGTVHESMDSRDFQLVSWGTDRVLRLHRMDEETLAKVGYVRGQQVKRTIPFTRKNAAYKSFRKDPSATTNDLSDPSREVWHDLDGVGQAGLSGMSSIGWGRKSLGVSGIWGPSESVLASAGGKKARSSDDLDAISWMKGVKIGKREASHPSIPPGATSILSPGLKSTQLWDTYDSLAEEITHLADTFGRVTFEKIDMQNRRVVVSLNGPWGMERASVYTKCIVEVPLAYPSDEAPSIDLESTAGISDETMLQAISEVQRIAFAYQERQMHSLEAILRYLLGEQSCDSTLSLLKALPTQPSLELDQKAELSSSDEEDEEDGQATDLQVPGLESSDGMLAVANAQYNVPLPKACGALWADDGRLVCFFPPKVERPPSFLQSMSVKSGDWSSKHRKNLVEGFGRLRSNSPMSKRTSSDLETVDSGDSDFDDSSGSSVSSSSNGLPTIYPRMMPVMTWREGFQESNRALSIDDSQRSTGVTGQSKSMLQNAKNFVSIHDFAELLPSRILLAEGYILQPRNQCCAHNAAVARQIGQLDLADIWDLIDLIIKDEVPLEKVHRFHSTDSISLIARRVASPLHSRDSAIDLSYDSQIEKDQRNHKGGIYWGSHPFGNRWLVDTLFEYFEKLADVQMLAMLSCILQTSSSKLHAMSNKPMIVEHRPNVGLPPSHPLAQAERYFPSMDVASSLLLPPAKSTFSLEMQKPSSDPQSASSSVGATSSDPLTPFSTGLTPPSAYRQSNAKQDINLPQMPLSASPEQYKHAHRSSSNLASAFAASMPRSFSLNTPDTSVPLTTHPRRRLSPSTTYLGTATSQRRHSGSTSTSIKQSPYGSRLQMTPSEADGGESDAVFQTRLKNQDQFHNDGYALETLLDASLDGRYLAYRAMYADMLLSWGLPVASRKILQYTKPASPLRPSLKEMPQRANNSPIKILGASSERSIQDLLINHFRIDIPMPFQPDANDDESATPMITAAVTNDLTASTSNDPDEELDWYDVNEEDAEITAAVENDTWRNNGAYDSLARNLGGGGGARFLTPKPSQVWRGGGGESRKGSLASSGFSKLRRSDST
ncbi:MAG: hypothetical protein Q9220_000085 [cf. Caloplaca sp. 1 TL-2023]